MLHATHSHKVQAPASSAHRHVYTQPCVRRSHRRADTALQAANGDKDCETCPPPALSRRAELLALLGAPLAQATVAQPAHAIQPALLFQPAESIQCPEVVSELVVRAQQTSLSTAVASCKDMQGVDFDSEVSKLLKRELKYAFDGGRTQPDLSMLGGGGAEPVRVYDLVSYISWKVIAAHVKDANAQDELCRNFATLYLNSISPGALTAVTGRSSQRTETDVYQAICSLMDRLQQNGYLCRYQLVWDELPGTWPQDWMEQAVTLEGRPPTDSVVPEGLGFQLKLYLPADLEGSIALRSEEEAFWPSTVPTMVGLLLDAAGYKQAAVDTYFYQDRWSGPKSLWDQILLKLGDPLEQVSIDFIPTTLVMDWQVTPSL